MLLKNADIPPSPHTQHSRTQGKWSNAENFASEERKQSKNHFSPVKLESKKEDKNYWPRGRV